MAHKAAGAKLAGMSSNAKELEELRNRQAVYQVSVQELTAELTEVKTHLLPCTTKRPELLTRLDAVVSFSNRSIDNLAMWGRL